MQNPEYVKIDICCRNNAESAGSRRLESTMYLQETLSGLYVGAIAVTSGGPTHYSQTWRECANSILCECNSRISLMVV